MDPNENLKEQLVISKRIRVSADRNEFIGVAEIERLSDLVIALDEWLKGGGFLPKQWRTK